MYIKKFNEWSKEKKLVNRRKLPDPCPDEQEVWACSLGVNISDEIDGKGTEFVRPVLIIKTFAKSMVWAVPLTLKPNTKFSSFQFINDKELIVSALIYQFRALSMKRCIRKMYVVSAVDFREIQDRIKNFLNKE